MIGETYLARNLNVLETKIQLHEELRIYYVVDGYMVCFETSDRTVAKCHGMDIESALAKLTRLLEDLSLEQIRKLPRV